jgi:hypothetical protein
MNPLELQQLWKEVAAQSSNEENAVKNNGTNGFTIGGQTLLPTINGVMDGYMMPGMGNFNLYKLLANKILSWAMLEVLAC